MALHVSPDNFIRAESDVYFGGIVKDGSLGVLRHFRELSPVDSQLVIRQNRDTLYSVGVFDLDAGPVTITSTMFPPSSPRSLSAAGKRWSSRSRPGRTARTYLASACYGDARPMWPSPNASRCATRL